MSTKWLYLRISLKELPATPPISSHPASSSHLSHLNYESSLSSMPSLISSKLRLISPISTLISTYFRCTRSKNTKAGHVISMYLFITWPDHASLPSFFILLPTVATLPAEKEKLRIFFFRFTFDSGIALSFLVRTKFRYLRFLLLFLPFNRSGPLRLLTHSLLESSLTFDWWRFRTQWDRRDF